MVSKDNIRKELTCVSPYESGMLLLGIGLYLLLEERGVLPRTGYLWPVIMVIFGIWFTLAIKFRR